MPDLILVLGGTTEGRALAAALPDSLYSLAGRVADPLLPPGDHRIGGFGGVEGLTAWLSEHRPTAVVDATHPFAQQMSRHAHEACTTTGVPLLRLQRPGWKEQSGDQWHRVSTLEAAAALAPQLGERVLLTTGRQEIGPFLRLAQVVTRSVTAPDDLPAHWVTVLGRPPWSLEQERALLNEHRIDVMITKDSGGPSAPKLQAAREAGVPVILVDRPKPVAEHVVATVEQALAHLGRGPDPEVLHSAHG